jgi:hypothetical protein
MPSVLHLVTNGQAALVLPVIARQAAAGDTVTVALMAGATTPVLPLGVTVHHVPSQLTYDQLLDLIFAADQVIAW